MAGAAASAAHREEMAERERAREADLTIERLVQLARVAELLGKLVDAAREEAVAHPTPRPFNAGVGHTDPSDTSRATRGH